MGKAALGAVVSLVALMLAPGGAVAALNDTDLISRANPPSDAAGSDGSFEPSISADGRYVAFSSDAENLPGGTVAGQVYVRDTQTDTSILVSAKDGSFEPGTSDSYHPRISANGRYVAFTSSANNLAGGELGQQVYVRDIKENTTTVASAVTGGTENANGGSSNPSISPDGRYVAFQSSAPNLPGGNAFPGRQQVYVRDMKDHVTTLASTQDGINPGDNHSEEPSVSANGRYVAFESAAGNFPDGSGNLSKRRVYVRDIEKNTLTLASVDDNDDPGDGDSTRPWISANGRYVTFGSTSANLLNGEGGPQQVYVRDLKDNVTILASAQDGSTAAADGYSFDAALSDEGRYVVFTSDSANLPGNESATDQIYVRDMQTNATILASAENGSTTAGGNDSSFLPKISADGRYVVFQSEASNLPGGGNGVSQVYRRDVRGGPPRNINPPEITGEAVVGSELSCSTGTWDTADPPTEFAFQWRRGDADIAGATESDHAVSADDVEQALTCRVIATNAVGSTEATSEAVTVPTPDVPSDGGGPADGGGSSGGGAGGAGAPGPIDPGPVNVPGAGGSQSQPGPVGQPGGRRRPPFVFAAFPRRKVARAGRRVVVRFRLSRAARVRLRVRRAGKTIFTRTIRARAGRGRISWNGRRGRRRARPGKYTLVLQARTADGSTRTQTVRLRLRRPAVRSRASSIAFSSTAHVRARPRTRRAA